MSTRLVIAITVAVSGLWGLGACGGQADQVVDSAPTAGAADTSIFVAARWARAVTISTGLAVSQAAVEQGATDTDLRCSGIAANAPRGPELDELSNDALVTLGLVMAKGNLVATRQFVHVTGGLYWDQRRLTLLVRRLAREEDAFARVEPLNICAVLADWARSSYRTLPMAATRFQRQISPFSSRRAIRCQRQPPTGRFICSLRHAEKTTVQQINSLLYRYENSRQREIARETERREGELAARTRATLKAIAAVLTRHLRLDSMTLRLFDASLAEH
jgi:hypothetical protein